MAAGVPFDELATLVSTLEARVAELETWRVAHTAGMNRRQQQINQIEATGNRDRFLATLKRGRR